MDKIDLIISEKEFVNLEKEVATIEQECRQIERKISVCTSATMWLGILIGLQIMAPLLIV